MPVYVYIARDRGRETRTPMEIRSDLLARGLAGNLPHCIRVETESARVVWRKPMDETEFETVMRGRNGRS